MLARDFVYWLQGYFEILSPIEDQMDGDLTAKQVSLIKKHLALVFYHEIDPSMGGKEHQGKLNEIHHEAVPSQVTDLLHTQHTSTEELSIPTHLPTADIKYRC